MATINLDPVDRGENQDPQLEYLVELGGATFTVRITFLVRLDNWYMDLLDADEKVVWSGKAIRVDNFTGFRHLRVNSPLGMFIVYSRDDNLAEPDFDGMGSRVVLGFQDGTDIPPFVDPGRPVEIKF